MLERAECLISSPANGAYQNSAVLDPGVEVLAHKTVLEFHKRSRIGKAEEFLVRR